MAMNETLRRYPPLPVIPRVATAAFEFGGYEIPAGCMVVVSPIHTHHMSEWWSDPFRWDPDRFAPGRAEHERHTHSFAPFGGGPHMCLGLRFAEAQVKLVMHQLSAALPLRACPTATPCRCSRRRSRSRATACRCRFTPLGLTRLAARSEHARHGTPSRSVAPVCASPSSVWAATTSACAATRRRRARSSRRRSTSASRCSTPPTCTAARGVSEEYLGKALENRRADIVARDQVRACRWATARSSAAARAAG